jgi:hypothetical protein
MENKGEQEGKEWDGGERRVKFKIVLFSVS